MVRTINQIYSQKYPVEKLAKDPVLCVEAMGYLKALEEYLPSEQKMVRKGKASFNVSTVIAHYKGVLICGKNLTLEYQTI